jgi:hypothetical protein
MNRARGAATLLGLILLAGCGSAPASTPAAPSGSGINVTGTLDRGPAPTCPADEPCDPPAAGSLLAFTRPGHPDVTVRIGPGGSFAIHLDPGDYTITAQPPPFNGILEPSNVRVPDAGTVDLRLRIVRAAT